MTKALLVTGGAGFIGSHVVDSALAAGMSVRVLDNLSTGSLANLDGVRGDIDFREGDLRDRDAVNAACDGIELIVHLAALGSVPRSFADPISTHETNATGTLNLLLAARDNDARRLVFSSSSSVFGSNQELPKREDMGGHPLSPYAATKRIGEDYLRQFNEFFELDTVTVRFFNVFGPRQRADHVYAAVIPKFIDASLRGGAVEIHGDGLQRRDFTYVGNAVEGLMCLADTANKQVAGGVYHLACGESISLLQILDELDRLLERKVERHHVDSRPGDIKDSLADISKILEHTTYTPAVDVFQGLALTLEWMREIQSYE